MQPIDPGYHRKNEKNPPSGSGNMSDYSYKNSKISTRQDQHLRMCVNCTREIGLLISQLAVFCTCDVLFYKILKQLTIWRFYLSRGPICV